jgi:hypothetical protein
MSWARFISGSSLSEEFFEGDTQDGAQRDGEQDLRFVEALLDIDNGLTADAQLPSQGFLGQPGPLPVLSDVRLIRRHCPTLPGLRN